MKYILLCVSLLLLVGGFWMMKDDGDQEGQVATPSDYKNIQYLIDGRSVLLKDGVAETEAAEGYYLGDRIAPQNINLSPNPRHKSVVVVNYADRLPGEPMTAQPSLGQSAYLKLDSESMMWGIVEPDFEGESR